MSHDSPQRGRRVGVERFGAVEQDVALLVQELERLQRDAGSDESWAPAGAAARAPSAMARTAAARVLRMGPPMAGCGTGGAYHPHAARPARCDRRQTCSSALTSPLPAVPPTPSRAASS